MALYTDDSKERVRDAVDMVDLVGSRTELRRAGANRFEGLCPFHDERTPSFGINPAEKLFYCFGCSEGGDVFKFVQLTEGLDFKGALEHLADRYGVELELAEEDPGAAERRRARERLLELLERTAAFYVRYLWDSDEAAPARTYLLGRGLEEGTLREFRVGYAPSAWDKVLLASRRGGFSNRELWEAGLAQRGKGEGKLFDRFRRRIMFPLCDTRGRVLGFGARALGAGQQPKYVNSSDNAVYHKGRHLFGADIARAPAAKAGSVVVAEGYTDVIALHQAGLRNTVGLMGTALTEEQVAELARLAGVVQLALDADSAGQEAMLRAARLAAGRRLEMRVVPLPAGSDPADLVQERGGAAVADIVEASVPFVRFRVERELGSGDLTSAEGKDRVIDALRPVFADVPPSAMREELVALVADRTDLAASLVASWLAQPPPQARGGPASGRGAPGRPVGGDERRSGTRAPQTGGAGRGPGAPPNGAGGGGRGAAVSGSHPGGDASASGARGDGAGAGSERPHASESPGSTPGPPAAPGDEPGSARRHSAVLDAAGRAERTFLAQCLAVPGAGGAALDGLDLEATFTSPLTRRAAAHLRDHLAAPSAGLPDDDPELATLVAELAVRAAQARPSEAALEGEALTVQLLAVERQISETRAHPAGDLAPLVARRQELRHRRDRAIERAMAETQPTDRV